MDIQTVIHTLRQQKETLRSYGLRRVGVFGSFARHEEQEKSDLDMLLDFEPKKKTYRNFFASTTFLERIFKRSVDAVTPQSLNRYLKPRVEKEVSYVQISD